ncbi:MAG: phytanoyl-CoA dioxygenase [Pseudomonadales bacterium]|nr:phytanoyl-CoA dioxygenase [Pseudomonadales bacterium]
MGNLSSYFEKGAERAMSLGNRGPLRFAADGAVHPDIIDAYWKFGFYVLEGVVDAAEVQRLQSDFAELIDRAPAGTDAKTDHLGRPSIQTKYPTARFQFAKPLSDPMGGIGRYQVKMEELESADDAPEETLLQVNGVLQLMRSCLHLYGHPDLLAIAAAINGPDFVPFTDAIWVKEPGLGPAVSWHQDGMTHWDSPTLDRGTHGFNFMTQLYRTTPASALWIVPGTHDIGHINIADRIENNDDSVFLPDAVPLLAEPGDVAVCSRQMLHGSFPNPSTDARVTYVFGFHRRESVVGVEAFNYVQKKEITYDEERIAERSKVIALAIDARAQLHQDETPYRYEPCADVPDLTFTPENERDVLHGYNLKDLFI